MRSYHVKRRDGSRWHAGNYASDEAFSAAHPWADLRATLRLSVADYPTAARRNPNAVL